jgi:hypothetical protein
MTPIEISTDQNRLDVDMIHAVPAPCGNAEH